MPEFTIPLNKIEPAQRSIALAKPRNQSRREANTSKLISDREATNRSNVQHSNKNKT